jgi:predicted metal-binding protein
MKHVKQLKVAIDESEQVFIENRVKRRCVNGQSMPGLAEAIPIDVPLE